MSQCSQAFALEAKHQIFQQKNQPLQQLKSEKREIACELEQYLKEFQFISEESDRVAADSYQSIKTVKNDLKMILQKPREFYQQFQSSIHDKHKKSNFNFRQYKFQQIYQKLCQNALLIIFLQQLRVSSDKEVDSTFFSLSNQNKQTYYFYKQKVNYFKRFKQISLAKTTQERSKFLKTYPQTIKIKELMNQIQKDNRDEKHLKIVHQKLNEIILQLTGLSPQPLIHANLSQIECLVDSILKKIKQCAKHNKANINSLNEYDYIKQQNQFAQLLQLILNHNLGLLQEAMPQIENRHIQSAISKIIQQIQRYSGIIDMIYDYLFKTSNNSEITTFKFLKTLKNLNINKKFNQCQRLIKEISKCGSRIIEQSHIDLLLDHQKTQYDRQLMELYAEKYQYECENMSLKSLIQDMKNQKIVKASLTDQQISNFICQVQKLESIVSKIHQEKDSIASQKQQLQILKENLEQKIEKQDIFHRSEMIRVAQQRHEQQKELNNVRLKIQQIAAQNETVKIDIETKNIIILQEEKLIQSYKKDIREREIELQLKKDQLGQLIQSKIKVKQSLSIGKSVDEVVQPTSTQQYSQIKTNRMFIDSSVITQTFSPIVELEPDMKKQDHCLIPTINDLFTPINIRQQQSQIQFRDRCINQKSLPALSLKTISEIDEHLLDSRFDLNNNIEVKKTSPKRRLLRTFSNIQQSQTSSIKQKQVQENQDQSSNIAQLKILLKQKNKIIRKYQFYFDKYRKQIKKLKADIFEQQTTIRLLQLEQIKLKKIIQEYNDQQFHYISEVESNDRSIQDNHMEQTVCEQKLNEKQISLKVKEQEINIKIEQIISHVLKLGLLKTQSQQENQSGSSICDKIQNQPTSESNINPESKDKANA